MAKTEKYFFHFIFSSILILETNLIVCFSENQIIYVQLYSIEINEITD